MHYFFLLQTLKLNNENHKTKFGRIDFNNKQSKSYFMFKIREERAAAAQLKLLNSPSFDYFARLKETMKGTESEKHYSMTSPTHEDEDYFKVQKAPMMSLLPGELNILV
jgi:hypothetical protein